MVNTFAMILINILLMNDIMSEALRWEKMLMELKQMSWSNVNIMTMKQIGLTVMKQPPSKL